MKTTYMNLSAVADSAISQIHDRAQIIAAAVAFAVAGRLALPSSPVESPVDHFNTLLDPQVRALVSDVNENVVFDVSCVLAHTRTHWLVRYAAAHPLARPVVSQPVSFFEAICGVGVVVEPSYLAFLNGNKDAILRVGAAVVDALTLESDRLAAQAAPIEQDL